jgi:hypothetical protein
MRRVAKNVQPGVSTRASSKRVVVVAEASSDSTSALVGVDVPLVSTALVVSAYRSKPAKTFSHPNGLPAVFRSGDAFKTVVTQFGCVAIQLYPGEFQEALFLRLEKMVQVYAYDGFG